jgi:NADP-dependent 3-hydroxy acid dehydrogenase YdfG
MSLLGQRLDDKTAFITGASSGIGAAIAERLCQHGAQVVLGARRLDKLDEVVHRIKKAVNGAKILALPLDVNDEESVDAWLERGAREMGPVDILVNNAGLAAGADPVVSAERRHWDAMLETNVRSVFLITQKVVTDMIERGGGDIAMIASVAGLSPYPGGSVYCASKAAVQAFAKSLRYETNDKNIRVLTFDPGMVETEFSVVRFDGDASKAEDVYQGVEPLTAGEVADCVAFGLTRPRHMCLDSMMIMATAQAGTRGVHRES